MAKEVVILNCPTSCVFLLLALSSCLALQLGCIAPEQDVRCMTKLVNSMSTSGDGRDAWRAIHDSVSRWAENGVEYMSGYLDAEWNAPTLILDDAGKRGLGILLSPSTDQLHWVVVEKSGGRWNVFFARMTTALLDREANGGRPFTLAQMRQRAVEYFLEIGALSKGACDLNEEVINCQFTQDLYEAHRRAMVRKDPE